jgi:N-acetylmuramic acid 6-phosphate etherase
LPQETFQLPPLPLRQPGRAPLSFSFRIFWPFAAGPAQIRKRSCPGPRRPRKNTWICLISGYNGSVGGSVMLTTSMTPETTGASRNGSANGTGHSTGNGAGEGKLSPLQDLITESQNEASQGFDTKSALEIARIINHEDAKVAAAVKKAIPEIAQVIDQVARSLRDGGRLIYIGAGSSGRIAALDSSECPPTYSIAPGQVQYIMAGGPKALASAVEVNEDSEELGQRDVARRRPTRKDVVIGVSASGRTPYVVAAVAYARTRGAYTAAVTCNHGTPLAEAADITVIAEVGPEVISGSTRMKAGTAQKMVLNMITTGALTRLGYVYENLMVNVHMQNSKLVERGIRILMCACKIDRATAVETIKSAGRSVPVALVMLKARVDKPEAVRRLAKSDGNVRLAIEDNVLEL